MAPLTYLHVIRGAERRAIDALAPATHIIPPQQGAEAVTPPSPRRARRSPLKYDSLPG